MRHITKILAVVMAIVLLSGQVVYAWDPLPGLRRLDINRLKDVMKKIGPYLVPGVGIGVKMATDPDFRQKVNNRITTDLSRAKDWMHKNAAYVAIGAFAPAGLIIAKNPDLRQKFIEGARKIGPYLLSTVGIAAFRRPLGNSLVEGRKPVGGNQTAPERFIGGLSLGGAKTGFYIYQKATKTEEFVGNNMTSNNMTGMDRYRLR